MTPIAHIETVYKTKFGVPRQAGLVDIQSRIVFEPEYRVPEAVRGLEEFDYLWLIWGFHLNSGKRISKDEMSDDSTSDSKIQNSSNHTWSPTVRPPRLGGNKRVGVFATRSPFRPNPIGLSSVRLVGVTVEQGLGPVITVSGADLVDGTPVYDIKPYIAYADSHPDARSGFAQEAPSQLEVTDPDGLMKDMPETERNALVATLSQDPRPHYQDDPSRVYAMLFSRMEVKFRVENSRVIVVGITRAD